MKKIIACALALFASVAFGATLAPVGLLNPAGSSSGQAIVSTGASSAPTWGTVTAGSLAAQAANTVVANVTASSASPTAVALPSCSTSASALSYTTSTGFSCNTSVNAAQLGGATFAAPGPIGSTTASTGAFTTLSASSTVSGSGFSTYLASPPAIGTTAAAAGKFTTLQATSTITPSSTSGIVGTTTNDSAQAGSWGEYPSPTNLTSVSLTSGTAANCASIALTAGDWDVQGIVEYDVGTATGISTIHAGVNTTSAILDTTIGDGKTATLQATFNTNPQRIPTPLVRVSLASSGTAYIVGQASFSGGTYTCSGFARARRVR